MPQFPQSLRLDLPDAFPCDMELFSDFLKCPASSIFQPKPQSQYFLFPVCQRLHDFIQLLLQKRQLIEESCRIQNCRLAF